jgi:AraC-like DNA-binding protein
VTSQALAHAVAAMPLVFHDRIAAVDRDPEVLASRLAQLYSLLDFGPRSGWERRFLHRSSSAVVGDLVLTCGYTSPIQGTIGERPGVGSINICFGGSSGYQLDRQLLKISRERPLYFAPGLAYRYSVDHFSGMAFDIDLARLRSTAAAMAGIGVSERRFAADLDQPRTVACARGINATLLRLLRRELALLDVIALDPAARSLAPWAALRLDDLIYRTLALLLIPGLPALLEAEPLPADAARERIFRELLEWIHANLEQPISLSQLEQRSGYSRRCLQLAFQQAYGCGPIQWIRRERLDQARRALLDPAPDDSVAAVASRYGFGSLSAFSREFRHQFGLRPSDLLREGRRQQG